MKKITTILFDFDGTLINTDPVIIESFKHAFRTYGVELPESRIIASMGGVLEGDVALMCSEYGLDIDPAVVVKEYRKHHDEIFFDYIAMFDGMPEALEELKSHGYTLAIVTARRRESTLLGLEKFGVTGLFDRVFANGESDYVKPDPRLADQILSQLDRKKEETVIVGDSRYDVSFARNSSVISILAGWSRADVLNNLGGVRPDFVLASPSDILPTLESL